MPKTIGAIPGLPPTLKFVGSEFYLLDQRQLPHRQEYLQIGTPQDLKDAIAQLSVRGAPAIGVAAAHGMAHLLSDRQHLSATEFAEQAGELATYLKGARPTAVNLAWAVDRLTSALTTSNINSAINSGMASFTALKSEAEAIHAEDVAMCEAMGAAGAELIKPGMGLLTHCNAGALATSHIGTATAPMYHAQAGGIPFKVYADETRPLYQGARLTAWELAQAGIDVTLICDNSAASLMAAGEIDLVIVGTDRVAANGDVVNKIGTLNLAVLCQHYGVPFYVACPLSTFDPNTPCGADVIIEQRDSTEVLGDHGAAVAVHNAAFDVTPAALVTGIITNRGIARQPLADSLAENLAAERSGSVQSI